MEGAARPSALTQVAADRRALLCGGVLAAANEGRRR